MCGVVAVLEQYGALNKIFYFFTYLYKCIKKVVGKGG